MPDTEFEISIRCHIYLKQNKQEYLALEKMTEKEKTEYAFDKLLECVPENKGTFQIYEVEGNQF